MEESPEQWLLRRQKELKGFAEQLGATQIKLDEIEQEFLDYFNILKSLVALLPISDKVCAWDVGWERSLYNLTFHSKIAPRQLREIDEWSLQLWEKIYNTCGMNPIEAGQLLGLFQVETRQLWQDSRWFGKEPTPKQQTSKKAPSEHNNEKLAREKAAIESFLAVYNSQSKTAYYLKEMQDKPDALLESEDGLLLGVEIADLYNEDAQLLLGRSPQFSSDAQSMPNFVEELNKILDKKEIKVQKYFVDYPVALLIRAISPIFTISNFQAHLERGRIRIPKNAFHSIWLLTQEDEPPWSDKLLQLF